MVRGVPGSVPVTRRVLSSALIRMVAASARVTGLGELVSWSVPSATSTTPATPSLSTTVAASVPMICTGAAWRQAATVQLVWTVVSKISI